MENIVLEKLCHEAVKVVSDTWNHPLRNDGMFHSCYMPPAMEDIDRSISKVVRAEGERLGNVRFKKFDYRCTILPIDILEDIYCAVSDAISTKIYEYMKRGNTSSFDDFMENVDMFRRIKTALYEMFLKLGIFST